jgi:hypothetical protein
MIKRIRAAFSAFFVFGTIVAVTPASAVPLICVMPTSGTVSGLTLVQDINNCFGTALGLFASGSAPDSPTPGMLWWNTSTGQVAEYDGTASNWNNLWTVDATNHLNAVQIGGGVQATLASASVTDLWSVPASSVSVTGSTTITQLANAHAVPGTVKIVTFAGALTLTQGGGAGGTPLNLPNNGGNIVTAAGDYAIVLALTATNVQVIHYERATGAALSTVGLNVGASALGASALGSLQQPVNMTLTTSVSSFNLTIGIAGQNGSAISSTNPVLVNFRSQTLTATGYNVFANIGNTASAPPAFTISLGSTMGCSSGVLCRIWVTLICQTESPAGTGCTQVLLGASVQSSVSTCQSLQEDALQSTGAGTGGGAVVGTIYSTTGGLSGKAVRIVGYIEDTWTSGTGWGSPTKIQLFGPGVKKPCDLVQTVYASNGTPAGTSSNSPQTFLSQAITPQSAANLIRITAGAYGTTSAVQSNISMQIFRGSTGLAFQQAIGCTAGGCSTAAVQAGLSFIVLDQISSTQTYALKYLSGNGVNGVTIDGAAMTIDEIMGSLEPGNDAGAQAPNHKLAAREWVGGRHERAA